jgi:hypothetical protein
MSRAAASVRLAAAAAIALAPAGCAVVRAARGEPGTDVSIVAPGTPRTAIEERVGAPLHEWRSGTGVDFRTYRYDPGYAGSFGDAAGIAFLDVITLFVGEVICFFRPEALHVPNKGARVVVAYGADGVALGAFDEYAVLPADGRATPGSPAWTPAPRR